MSVTGPDPVRATGVAGQTHIATGNLIGAASTLTWACGFPVSEILLQSWPPLALITVRFALAVSFLITLWATLDGPRALLTARWGRGTIVGGLTFGSAAYLLLVAQWLTDAVTVAIIASSTPIAGALIEMIGGTRRLSRNFVLGIVASVVGGVVATGASDVDSFGLGVLVAILASFLFALGSHMTVRDHPNLSHIGRSAVTFAGGLVFTSIALFITLYAGGDVYPTRAIDAEMLVLLALYGFIAMGVSQVLWMASVGRLGVAVASFHLNVAPFYVMLIMLALGEGWSWAKAIGAAIVILGVIVAQKPAPMARS